MSVIFVRRPCDSPIACASAAREVGARGAAFDRRRTVHRRLDIVALAGSAAAITAIALGAPIAGLAIWVAALVPLIVEA
jgi:hypothetical protein